MGDATERAKTSDVQRLLRTDRVYEKEMTTKATLHRDGKVVVKTRTSYFMDFVSYSASDVNGDVIGVTDKICCTTRGGLSDSLLWRRYFFL